MSTKMITKKNVKYRYDEHTETFSWDAGGTIQFGFGEEKQIFTTSGGSIKIKYKHQIVYVDIYAKCKDGLFDFVLNLENDDSFIWSDSLRIMIGPPVMERVQNEFKQMMVNFKIATGQNGMGGK